MISRLQARLDLQILLGGSDELIKVSQVSPYEVTWTRNLPAVADELEVSFDSSLLPVDLRGVRGVQVLFWLFEHQDPRRCAPGDPGFFSGYSDEIGRRRTERTVTLSCRDWTAAVLDAKVTPKELKSVDVQKLGSLEAVVKRLLSLGPASSDWEVRSLSAAGARNVFTTLSKNTAIKRVAAKGKGKTPKQATQRRQFTLEALADGDETAVWDVVCQLCARMGVVPEVTAGEKVPVVLLVDALDLQTSDVLRPFARNGSGAGRTLTLGRTVATFDETLRLTRDADLPDQVVVGAWDHEKGTMVEVAFPYDAKAKKGDKLRRVYQVAEGTADQAVLTRVAAAAWAATRQHQLEVEVETWSPWSDGGGPHDPDLLDIGAGAALAIQVSGAYAHNLAREEREAFERLDDKVQEAFTSANASVPRSLLFQVGEVTHTFSAGDSPDYACRLKINAFLGEQPEPPKAA